MIISDRFIFQMKINNHCKASCGSQDKSHRVGGIITKTQVLFISRFVQNIHMVCSCYPHVIHMLTAWIFIRLNEYSYNHHLADITASSKYITYKKTHLSKNEKQAGNGQVNEFENVLTKQTNNKKLSTSGWYLRWIWFVRMSIRGFSEELILFLNLMLTYSVHYFGWFFDNH